MAINVDKIKTQVARAISNLPTTITLKRTRRVSDGYGGFIVSEIDVATFDCFMDMDTTYINISVHEGGELQNLSSVSFIAVKETTFNVRIEDYFILNNIKYEVTHPKDIHNIYWDVIAKAVCQVERFVDVKVATGVATGLNPTSVGGV